MATRGFPKDELYSLSSQFRPAAYSVPANVAGGASRSSMKDYRHFLYIARGSLSEAACFIHLCRRLDYLDPFAHAALTEQADEASRVLTGLIRSVEKKASILSWTVAKASSAIVLALGLTSLVSSL